MIELVIRLQKKLYDEILSPRRMDEEDASACYDAIKNGIPLPKGHGKIVDIKPLMVGLYEGMGKENFSPIEVYKMLDEECRVIIEADKEGAEK